MEGEGGGKREGAGSVYSILFGRMLSSRLLLTSILVVALITVVAVPFGNEFLLFSLVLANIYMGLALAWDFSSGLTGYINFGLAFFFGLGAFTTGFLFYSRHIGVAATLPVDLVVGMAAGFLFAIPTLRFRGPFFTLLSLILPLIATSFVLAFWNVFLDMPTIGYYGIPMLGSSYRVMVILTAIVDVLFLLVFTRLYGSKFGLILRGIRDDEAAISAQGINTFWFKIIAFTLASGLMGVMGGFYASLNTFAGVDSFGLDFLLYPMLIAVMGGFGLIVGSVSASYVVTLLSQYLNLVVGSFTLIIFSAIAIVLVFFIRGGIVGLAAKFGRAPAVAGHGRIKPPAKGEVAGEDLKEGKPSA